MYGVVAVLVWMEMVPVDVAPGDFLVGSLSGLVCTRLLLTSAHTYAARTRAQPHQHTTQRTIICRLRWRRSRPASRRSSG